MTDAQGDSKNEKNQLATILFNVVKGKELKEMTIPLVEVALDSQTGPGILRDIPIVGTAYKALTMGASIRDAIYERKIAKFLYELKDIPEEKRRKFSDDIHKDAVKREKLGMTLIDLVDKADDEEKASIFGQLMAAFIRDELEYSMLLRLCFMVNRSFLDDLALLYDPDQEWQHAQELTPGLVTAGFLRVTGHDAGIIENPQSEHTSYERTTFGNAFIELVTLR